MLAGPLPSVNRSRPGLWEIHHFRERGPARAGPQILREHSTQIQEDLGIALVQGGDRSRFALEALAEMTSYGPRRLPLGRDIEA